MTRTVALVLAFVALGAAAAVYLRAENCYVLVAWRDWVLETSLLGPLAFRVTYLFERDNRPVEGFLPEDVTLSASLVWKR